MKRTGHITRRTALLLALLILLASHNIQDIEELCDTVCEMDAGVMTMVKE